MDEQMLQKTKQLEDELEEKRKHEAVRLRIVVARVHTDAVTYVHLMSFFPGIWQELAKQAEEAARQRDELKTQLQAHGSRGYLLHTTSSLESFEFDHNALVHAPH